MMPASATPPASIAARASIARRIVASSHAIRWSVVQPRMVGESRFQINRSPRVSGGNPKNFKAHRTDGATGGSGSVGIGEDFAKKKRPAPTNAAGQGEV